MRHTKRFATIMVVLMSLAATAAYSQSQSQQRTRIAPQARSRSNWQQGGMMPLQGGQSDFAARMAERNARRMQEMQQDIEDMQRQAQESRDRAIQQAMHASDDQWRQLKPKLERIQRLKAEAEVAANPGSMGGNNVFQMSGSNGNGNFQSGGFMFGGGSGGSGGFGGFGGGPTGGMGQIDIMDSNSSPSPMQNNNWSSFSSSGPGATTETSEGTTLCLDLQRLLQSQIEPSAEVLQKIAALRRIRANAREGLAKARQELRGLIHPNQEPALIVMGYLD